MESWLSVSALVNSAPWSDGEACIAAVAKHLGFDALLVTLLDDLHPRADELLIARGWTPEQTRNWLEPTGGQKLIHRAKRKGNLTIRGADLETSDPLRRAEHLFIQVMPANSSFDRWWILAVARSSAPFTRREHQFVAHLLHYWKTCFDHVAEPNMGRMFIGHDNRLIHADPLCQIRMLGYPESFACIINALHPIVRQRWPRLENGQTHDFAIQLPTCGDAPCWVRFQRDCAADLPNCEHWYLEARRIDPGDLPAIGVIEDERIALALGYFHDHFGESPNLTAVAHAVHVSPFHFHRVFTRMIKLSPKQYLQRKQLQVAKWLLRSSRQSIGEVASKSGFASHGHFTSTFHRVVGVSPGQYRDGQGQTFEETP